MGRDIFQSVSLAVHGVSQLDRQIRTAFGLGHRDMPGSRQPIERLSQIVRVQTDGSRGPFNRQHGARRAWPGRIRAGRRNPVFARLGRGRRPGSFSLAGISNGHRVALVGRVCRPSHRLRIAVVNPFQPLQRDRQSYSFAEHFHLESRLRRTPIGVSRLFGDDLDDPGLGDRQYVTLERGSTNVRSRNHWVSRSQFEGNRRRRRFLGGGSQHHLNRLAFQSMPFPIGVRVHHYGLEGFQNGEITGCAPGIVGIDDRRRHSHRRRFTDQGKPGRRQRRGSVISNGDLHSGRNGRDRHRNQLIDALSQLAESHDGRCRGNPKQPLGLALEADDIHRRLDLVLADVGRLRRGSVVGNDGRQSRRFRSHGHRPGSTVVYLYQIGDRHRQFIGQDAQDQTTSSFVIVVVDRSPHQIITELRGSGRRFRLGAEIRFVHVRPAVGIRTVPVIGKVIRDRPRNNLAVVYRDVQTGRGRGRRDRFRRSVPRRHQTGQGNDS